MTIPDKTPNGLHDKTVVVLYGALRSGTTLMRLILDAHPDIRCPGERDFMLDFLQVDDGKVVLNAARLQENRIFRDTGLDLPETTDGKAAFEMLLAQDCRIHDKPVHVLVLHRELDQLLSLIPDVRIIHMVRDPRDVARSSIGMGWAGNCWYGITHWIGTERDWNEQTADLSKDQICEVQYEQLLRAPQETLERLCTFIGLPYSERMMDYSATSTYEPLDPALAEQWRHKLSPRELAEVEHKAGNLLLRSGYAPSVAAPRAPGVMRRIHLWVQNKRGVWKTRIARHGLIDPLLVATTRWTGLRRLSKRARARIQENSKQYLK
ncbi:MAG: hypothetical protein ACJAZ1_000069 [Yoonia sp.]|jgi:hypothetical protein